MTKANSELSQNQEKSPLCMWCGAHMAKTATVCQTCDRHQSRPYEIGKQLLTLFGVIGAIASAVAFVWPFADDLIARWSTPEIEVRSLRSESNDTLIRNIGQRPVVVSHFQADIVEGFKSQKAFSEVINETLRPGEVLKLDLESRRTKRIQASEALEFFRFISVSAPGHRDAFLKASLRGSDEEKQKLRFEIIGKDTAVYKNAESGFSEMSHSSELMFVPFKCGVFFSDTADVDEIRYDIPCVGVPSTTLSDLEFATLMEKYK